MKDKIKIILYTLSILLLSFTNAYSIETKISNPPEMNDARLACKAYFEKLSKSDDNTVRNFYTYYTYDDYGFYIKLIFDFKNNEFVELVFKYSTSSIKTIFLFKLKDVVFVYEIIFLI